MRLLCPACHAELPEGQGGDGPVAVLACPRCAAEVDVSRAGTAVGRPRFVPDVDRRGQALGPYQLEERLGAGGMGVIYRARGAHGERVAVKVLSPSLAGDADLVARFAREVALLEGLDHPGIVRVRAHGEAEGVPWFAMDLVEGRDLRARLALGVLPPRELGEVFGAVCGALAHAHKRRVIHRDLKPANVFLPEAGGARLGDFGVALPGLDASGATRLTETAAVVGTLPYMSPEQRAGQRLDARSDLFSLGVIIYEAATGRLPVGAFPPPSRLVRKLPRALDRVVMTLLAPEPQDRYQSAEEAGLALAAALRPPRAIWAAAGAGAVAVLAFAGTLAPAVLGRQFKEAPVVPEPAPAQVAPAPRPSPAPEPPAQGLVPPPAQALSPAANSESAQQAAADKQAEPSAATKLDFPLETGPMQPGDTSAAKSRAALETSKQQAPKPKAKKQLKGMRKSPDDFPTLPAPQAL